MDEMAPPMTERPNDYAHAPLAQRFHNAVAAMMDSGEEGAGGDQSIMDAVIAEAAKMGAEGVPVAEVLRAARMYNSDGGPNEDDYAFGGQEDRVDAIMGGYNQGARSGQAQRGSSMANDIFKGR